MPVPPQIDIGLVAAILAALAILMIAGAISILRADVAFRRRLRNFSSVDPSLIERQDEALIRHRPGLLQRFNSMLTRGELFGTTRRELQRAGSPLRVSQFFYLRVIVAVLGFLLSFVVTSWLGPLVQFVLTILGSLAGWLAPFIIIRVMQQRRLARFERHLPDAIDIMAGSLEAGSSLPMALELVAREIPAPVSTEFGRALREVSLGMALDDALLNMLDRVYSTELDMLATAVAIQYRVGGNLADVLRAIAHTIRERVRIRNDVRTMTAQQTFSANLLALLPVALALLLFLLNPSYERRLFDPGFPQFATISAVVMVFVAFIILRRIVNIDV